MSHVSYLSPKSAGGDSDDGQTRFDVLSDNDPSPQPAAASESAGAGAAVVSPEQVHVQIPATAAPPAKKPAPVAEPAKKASPAPMAAPAAVKIAAPVAAAASSSTASRKSAAPLSSPIAANGVTAGQMAHVKSQVTAACHITPATGDGSEGNVFVHVIDGQGVFGCTPADLTYLVLHASTRPSDYSVVGIMGCQSTGKSTLLNLLFGTKFQMMDSSQGRSQTTKGVWMDSGDRKRDLVIMDLEGTDSGERGEDRTTFERQTSLYALAVAEVLLINMWEHDIGRYTASNYGILKTVFEVNLQLFDTQNKTILMFVIRDHIEEDTPFTQLVEKLKKEVQKIWTEIRKPDKFEKTPVEDLFQLRFFALPHMKLQKQLFTDRVTSLRLQFTDPSDREYLFAGEFHGKKSVPADGFGVYMQQCWETIQTNKELNLPTQKEMLATFRCDEIIAQLFSEEFLPTFSGVKERAQKELVADAFATELNPLLLSILRSYSDATAHYHSEIAATKKVEFLRKMSRELEELFQTQARKWIGKAMVEVFKREMQKQLSAPSAAASSSAGGKSAKDGHSSSDAPHPNFTHACSVARSAAQEYAGTELAKFSLDILSPSGSDLASGLDATAHANLVGEWAALGKKVEEELAAGVEREAALERQAQLKKLSFHLDKVYKTLVSVPLNATLKKAHPQTMWREVGELWRKVRKQVIQQYVLDTLLPHYNASPEERQTIEAQSEKQLHQLFRMIVDQHAAMIGTYMRSKFDRLFRSDASGRIRTWTASENIRALFRHARDEALKQLDLFAVFRLDEYADEGSERNVRENAGDKAEEEEDDVVPSSSGASSGSTLKSRKTLSRRSSVKRADAVAASPSSDESKDSLEDDDDDASIGQTTVDYSAVDAANIILDPTQRLEKESNFRLEIEGALREAEIAQAQNASNTKVPLWMIGLVCFLGMDEILAVLRNPLLLFFLVIFGGGAFMAHQVGALMPLIAVAKTTAVGALSQLQAGFTPVNSVEAAQKVSSGSSSASSSSSSRPQHGRNLSLAKSYTDAPSSPKTHGRTGSLASSDILPPTLAKQGSVEMADLSPRHSSAEGEEGQQQQQAKTTAKRRTTQKGE